jgi:hypothetical protein
MTSQGRHPPNPAWPNDARICVQFVLNYEEGGENNILHGDPHFRGLPSKIIGATNWPGQRYVFGVATALMCARAGRGDGGSGLGNRRTRAEMD